MAANRIGCCDRKSCGSDSEGHNFVFQLRSSDGDVTRLPKLATELVGSQVDVIVTTFTPCALAAKQATTSIPVVMAAVADPIGVGLVTSLANATRSFVS
jgi:ABC-type uncharacterized transport system substrate-binding protein